MNLNYQLATNQDIEMIYELNRALIDQYETIEAINYEYVLKWVRHKIETHINNYQVIWYEGKKVGYFYFHEEDGQFELDDLYIFEEYQSQGIGSEVLTHCVEYAKQQNQNIFLYVFAQNKGAIKLYQKFEFKIIEKIKKTRYIMIYTV